MKFVADYIIFSFIFFNFQRKCLDISGKLFVWKMINICVKTDLFSLKKKKVCCTVVLGTFRVKMLSTNYNIQKIRD